MFINTSNQFGLGMSWLSLPSPRDAKIFNGFASAKRWDEAIRKTHKNRCGHFEMSYKMSYHVIFWDGVQQFVIIWYNLYIVGNKYFNLYWSTDFDASSHQSVDATIVGVSCTLRIFADLVRHEWSNGSTIVRLNIYKMLKRQRLCLGTCVNHYGSVGVPPVRPMDSNGTSTTACHVAPIYPQLHCPRSSCSPTRSNFGILLHIDISNA